MRSKTNHTRALLCALFLLAASCAAAKGDVIYVDDDAAGTNDGSSWTDAFNHLQDALLTALAGDEIRVGQGIYTPTQDPSDRDATFDLKDGVSIRGGYAGLSEMYPDARDIEAFATILSGDIDHNDDSTDPNSRAGNSRHVVTSVGRGNAAVLEGVIITAGYAAGDIRFHNSSDGAGGGFYCRSGYPELIDCVFNDNYADRGAVYVGGASHPVFTRCVWEDNEAEGVGGAICVLRSSYIVSLNHCIFRRNTAGWKGGAIYADIMGEVRMVNCLFVANTAGDSGGAISYPDSNDGTGRTLLNLLNCTFYGNTSPTFYKPPTNSAKQPDGSWERWSGSVITNCIFYNEPSDMAVAFEFGSTEPLIVTSIYERWPEPGQRRIVPPAPDLLFVDPYGADGILGTEDDDFRLAPVSPAIDSGTNETDPLLPAMDSDGNPRIIGDRVDMGAYEFQGIIYVDGEVSENPSGYGTERHPFGSIQQGIDVAKDGYTVMVKPGVYGKIDFMGKAITVTGTEGAAVIKEPGSRTGARSPDAVTFHTGEGPRSVLKNFVIKDSGMAISLNYGSRPTIRNLTILDNNFGIAAYENSNPDISNCIFWNNREGDLFQCAARYSCFENAVQGEGNISANPLFLGEPNGDWHDEGSGIYRLRSEGHRWDQDAGVWTYDHVTSRCIDAGDPASPLGDEPMSVPRDPDNRFGLNSRINMGAFGGTAQASMPPLGWARPDYETVPPEPNPARWALNGTPREVGGTGTWGYRWVQMAAAEATDDSGWVEYFFECTTESDFSSGWQYSRDYEVRVGGPGLGHRFRVKARDLFGNETAWSQETQAEVPGR